MYRQGGREAKRRELSRRTASATSTIVPNTPATTAMAPTSRGEGPPCTPVSCTTACPFPRAISRRLTGSAAAPATTSATDRLPQKSVLSTPASIAPGIASMIALSTTSITAMLSVSEARAIGITAASANPARRSGRLVSA